MASQCWSYFRPIPALCTDIPDFYSKIFPPYATVGFLHPCPCRSRVQCADEGGWRGHTGGKNLFADVCAKLLWRVIYCPNPMLNAGSQSGYLSCSVLWSRSSRIIFQYVLATEILIQLVIHPCVCKMGSSIFAAMSRLKFVSTIRASLPIITSTEIKNVETCFYFYCWCLPFLSLDISSQININSRNDVFI